MYELLKVKIYISKSTFVIYTPVMALSRLLIIDYRVQFDIILIEINMTSKVRYQGSNLHELFCLSTNIIA